MYTALPLNRGTKTRSKELCVGKLKRMHIVGGVHNIYTADITGKILTRLKSGCIKQPGSRTVGKRNEMLNGGCCWSGTVVPVVDRLSRSCRGLSLIRVIKLP